MRSPLAIAVLTLTLVPASAATAQTALTLDDAVTRALATSHRLAEVRARQEGAAAAVQSRRLADDPAIVVSGGYTRTNHVEEFGVPQPNGVLRVIYPDVPDNVFSRVQLQWPIYTGGRTEALERAAAAEVRAVAEDLAAAQADLRLEVTRVYWALITAGEAIRVRDEAIARADTHLRDIRARFDNGLVPPNEVASVEAERAREEMQRIEAQNVRASLLEDLRRLTGIAGDIIPADRLAESTATEPTSSALQSGRAETRALAERIAGAVEREAAAAAARRPTVAFTGAVDYANPNPRIFPRAAEWQTSWELGVTASWTLWDSGRAAAETAEAVAATKALRARRDEVAALIATEVRQRELDLASARAALVAADQVVRSSAEARRVVGERFTVGVASSTDVLDAQHALLQAELERTRALVNIRLASARLDRARGH